MHFGAVVKYFFPANLENLRYSMLAFRSDEKGSKIKRKGKAR